MYLSQSENAIKIIIEQLTTQLNKDELISLSRVVVIKQDILPTVIICAFAVSHL